MGTTKKSTKKSTGPKWIKYIYIILLLVSGLFIILIIDSQKGDNQDFETNSTDTYTEMAEVAREDYSWIVGQWYCKTPYGTIAIQFEGDGQSGRIIELDPSDLLNPYKANYGSYSVSNDVIRYKMNGESFYTTIDIHSGHRLYAGEGYYYKRL